MLKGLAESEVSREGELSGGDDRGMEDRSSQLSRLQPAEVLVPGERELKELPLGWPCHYGQPRGGGAWGVVHRCPKGIVCVEELKSDITSW